MSSSTSFHKSKTLHFRDTRLFVHEASLDELQSNMETLQMQDVNTTFSKFALLFETMLNMHAPLRLMSREQQ